MLLTEQEKINIWAEVQRELSSKFESISVHKAGLRSAVDSIDSWIESNLVSFNQSIPEPARTKLTTKQKLRIFSLIIKHRWEVD